MLIAHETALLCRVQDFSASITKRCRAAYAARMVKGGLFF
jgi:hypothetical protein